MHAVRMSTNQTNTQERSGVEAHSAVETFYVGRVRRISNNHLEFVVFIQKFDQYLSFFVKMLVQYAT